MPSDQFQEAVQALRRANPIAGDDAGAADSRTVGDDERRLAAILGGDRRNDSAVGTKMASLGERRRRRFLKVTGTSAIAVVLLTTAAWAVIHRRNGLDPVSILCLNQPRTFAMPEAPGPPLQGVQAELSGDPVAACGPVWTTPQFDQPAQNPPPLVTCVLPSGVLAVLPGAGPSVCDQIGSARWTGRFRDDRVKLTSLADRLISLSGNHACLEESQATDAATAAVRDLELRNWRVKSIERPSEASPCATFGFDFSKRFVEIRFWKPLPDEPLVPVMPQ
jgi:hypothetical protein